MLARADVLRLFAYNDWANHRILRASATLDTDQYKRDLGSSHGGVRGTLAHAFWAEWVWLERFKGVSPTAHMDESEVGDVMALRERWRALEANRNAWSASLRERDLAAILRYRSVDGKRAYVAPLGELVQHVVNHSSYHRGQVTTLLRQLGAKAVATDLVAYDRERAGRVSRPRRKSG
jgi:uncharacterized damage-inducible protein DinB